VLLLFIVDIVVGKKNDEAYDYVSRYLVLVVYIGLGNIMNY
jgi:hypothetical protein